MTLFEDTITLYKREMAVFRASLRTNLIRSTIFPLIMILFIGNIGNSFINTPIVVVNNAGTPQAGQFINALTLNRNLIVQAITTEQEAFNLLNSGAASFIVVINPNFPGSASGPGVSVYYANSQFTLVGLTIPLIQQTAAKFGAGVQNYQSTFYLPKPNSQLQVESTPINGAAGSYKDFIFSGVIGIVVIFGAVFGGGISVLLDRQLGNMKIFLTAPINVKALVFSRMLAGGTQSLMYAASAVVIGLLNGANIAMGWLGLFWIAIIAVTLAFGFTAVTMILGSRIKNMQAYVIAGQAMSLPLWFLSGGIVPTSGLPSWLIPVSQINPMTYAVDALRYVILQGVFPIQNILIDFGVMLAFTVIATYACIKSFKSTID